MSFPKSLFAIVAGCCLTALLGCGSVRVTLGSQPLAGLGYQAFGDSITYGFTLPSPGTQAYPHLVASDTGTSVTDYAIIGDQACDIFPRQIFKAQAGYTDAGTGSVLSILIGTNDVDVKGLGSYETVFESCQQAVIAWLAVRQTDKFLAGDPRLKVSGGCAEAPNAEFFNGIFCAPGGEGTISTGSLNTSGRPLYVWYAISDATPRTPRSLWQ